VAEPGHIDHVDYPEPESYCGNGVVDEGKMVTTATGRAVTAAIAGAARSDFR
jgi:hypothetical protein